MNKQMNHMSRQEQSIKDLVYNCLVMSKEEQIIDHILAELGEYYDAERVCIYEVNEEYTHISNRNEWCSEGIASRIGSQQNLSLDGLKQWFEWLGKQGEFFLSSSSVSEESDSEARKMLEFQGVDCLMAAPIMGSDKITGFLCVNNPVKNTGDMIGFLELTAFEGNASSFMIHPNGRVILGSAANKQQDVYNFLAVLEKYSDLSDAEIKKFKDDLKAGKSGDFIVNLGGTTYYLIYEQTYFMDWTIIGLVPTNVVNQNMSKLQKKDKQIYYRDEMFCGTTRSSAIRFRPDAATE